MTTWNRPTFSTTSWGRAWTVGLEKRNLTWEEATIAWEDLIQQWQNMANTAWSNRLSSPNTPWT